MQRKQKNKQGIKESQFKVLQTEQNLDSVVGKFSLKGSTNFNDYKFAQTIKDDVND